MFNHVITLVHYLKMYFTITAKKKTTFPYITSTFYYRNTKKVNKASILTIANKQLNVETTRNGSRILNWNGSSVIIVLMDMLAIV